MSEENELVDVPDLVVPVVDVPSYPYDIAVIIDGVVFQIMNVDGQSAAQFLSQPTFVRVTNTNSIKVGWVYQNGEFAPPQTEPR